MRDSSGVRYLIGDHQGTSQVAINAGDQKSFVRRFTPFGQPRGTAEEDSWPNERGFLGGTADPTGLTHLGAREYDPDTGRFISVDPVIDAADPQQMNGYTYAGNSPVTYSDPSGETRCDVGACPTPEQSRCAPAMGGCTDTDGNSIPNGMGPNGRDPGPDNYGPEQDIKSRTTTLGNKVIVAPSSGALAAARNKARSRIPARLLDNCSEGNRLACDWTDPMMGKFICEDNPDWCISYTAGKEIPVVVAAAAATGGKSGSRRPP
ncbi:RHS repeat domain-containing protein [Actinomadura mexicana]|uniref:RHS repeat-associated core domain-containing protein n=1 Tax=Actinomadura mexicana TaxID=134959 RepID=A0A238XIN2_9ACTN|nr:RHS repeat-associated core domain-containing protein [Actinomadura mexicana]SNR57809.1 RHS repeat-associated core domain-containing protein [Actinomadura mexicana]